MTNKDITPQHRQSRRPDAFLPTAERIVSGMQDMRLLARPHIVDLISTEVPAPREAHCVPAQIPNESLTEFASKLAMRSIVNSEAS